VIVVEISPKGLIPCGQIYIREIIIINIISKLFIISLLSKNENRDKMVLKNKKYLYLLTDFSSLNYLKIDKKQPKISNPLLKLHRLHPFI
jgi:hypothetical protein